MPDNVIKVLFLGDVVGQSGNRAVFFNLKTLIKKNNIDFTIVNGENSADGFGIIPHVADQFLQNGADVITTGNHVWQKHEIFHYIDDKDNILRPANFPSGVPGHGYCIVEKKGIKLGVLNLQGRENMPAIDCPFRAAKEIVKKLKKETPLIFIDFHAESSSEKESLVCYLDGQVSVIAGTHTHVQTADERIFKNGTGYITDVGMTGPCGTVIGTQKEIAVERVLTQMPLKMEIADSPAKICGLIAEIDTVSGKTVFLCRICENV